MYCGRRRCRPPARRRRRSTNSSSMNTGSRRVDDRHRRVAQRAAQVAPQHRRRVGAGRRSSGPSGQGQEDVVEVGRVHGQLARPRSTRDPTGRAARAARRHCRPRGAGASAPRRRARRAEAPRGRLEPAPGPRTRSRMWPPRDEPLELLAVPSATIAPWSSSAIRSASWSASSRYCVVRKIGHAAGDEPADDLPHRAAAARIQAGGRLVEEDDPRVADERHREVEPAAHAAGVGRGRLVGRVDAGRSARAARRRGGGPRRGRAGAGRPSGSGSRSPVSRLSTAENWPVTPIAARTPSGSRDQIAAGDAQRAGVGGDQRREDLDDRRLAGAVGAEQREDRALGDVEVDAVEHERGRRRLAQSERDDREAGRIMPPPDRDVADAIVRARTSTFSSVAPGASAAPRACCRTRPAVASHVEPRGRALADADLDVAGAVSSTTEPRTTSPTRTSPLDDLATTLACATSTAMLPLAALTRRSPAATPTQVAPLEFLITALRVELAQRARRRSRS